jgi:hypothetical protein
MPFYGSLEKLPELMDLPTAERRERLAVCRAKKGWAVPVLAVGGTIGLALYVATLSGVSAGTWQWVATIFVGAFLGTYIR